MGGGIAHLGRRGKESPKLKKKMLKKFSTYGLWGKAHRGPQGAAPKDLEAAPLMKHWCKYVVSGFENPPI